LEKRSRSSSFKGGKAEEGKRGIRQNLQNRSRKKKGRGKGGGGDRGTKRGGGEKEGFCNSFLPNRNGVKNEEREEGAWFPTDGKKKRKKEEKRLANHFYLVEEGVEGGGKEKKKQYAPHLFLLDVGDKKGGVGGGGQAIFLRGDVKESKLFIT